MVLTMRVAEVRRRYTLVSLYCGKIGTASRDLTSADDALSDASGEDKK
jgi:hypothetical protein